ncbi:Gfo/Idh/MocA family protein [Methylobacterium gnaphalii]|uniref:Glucose-fructose oxidoreductase n=1 Tax=Methylobacterium gnaphalii TaxID=1010610 RepID=A0A512JNI8_9HYPH|nr:Gfo/Idh/MocA family oxidoreductase [Methylobacterium gnaphalii]GEP11423.1 glucose-fructose oxidoreductase [Methylobacterium gnaphalii]GJD71277.1 Glucose--fructose oxidoreductase [Methylobacterium gnaphalii]GLS48017.1 glucose-fructose oxidoreductase [Methylobacterium gnaphalii]
MSETTGSRRKVRYAVVGGGWISQAAFMPAVAQTGNSEITALITGDPEKAAALGAEYGLQTFSYGEYAQALQANLFDAVYLALPNGMHRDFAVPALEAGRHVLLEKPMATSVAECEAIIAAAQRANARLMIAYRLHFEPATLDAIERVRRGEIGDPRLFSAVFCQHVAPDNHRAKQGYWAGPVPDMGTYPINAARNLFGDEPISVGARGVRRPDSPYDCDETVAVTLVFPDERIAQFTVSYATDPVNEYRIAGTKGDLRLSPGFGFGTALKGTLTVGGETTALDYPSVDQFGAETRYFSDCILDDRAPEPDGEEGLADVRILVAIERALETGLMQDLAPMQRRTRPDASQVIELPEIEPPELVNAAEPGG